MLRTLMRMQAVPWWEQVTKPVQQGPAGGQEHPPHAGPGRGLVGLLL